MSKNADMVPPWEQFPTYERYTIGWRMGAGEDYIYKWRNFINDLPDDYETRLGYFKRHRPAPLTWCDMVLHFLYPGIELDREFGCSQAEIQKLTNLNLIEVDAAYQTWLSNQSEIVWPWSFSETPQHMVRYRTREFWFFSRQLNAARMLGDLKFEKIPNGWQGVERELLSGQLGDVDLTQGLLTLSQMLCAGDVKPPWNLGLSLKDFGNSFEMDMGFIDAFRLWMISSFDDKVLLQKILQETQVPNYWIDWVNKQTGFGLVYS